MSVQIPNFEDMRFTDGKGHFTPSWKNIMQQFFGQIKKTISNEGIKIPQQTTVNITALNTLESVGALLYDSDTDELKVCIKTSPTTAIFKTVQVV